MPQATNYTASFDGACLSAGLGSTRWEQSSVVPSAGCA